MMQEVFQIPSPKLDLRLSSLPSATDASAPPPTRPATLAPSSEAQQSSATSQVRPGSQVRPRQNGVADEAVDAPLPEIGRVVLATPRVCREVTSFLKISDYIADPVAGLFPAVVSPVVINLPHAAAALHGVCGYPVRLASTEKEYRDICAGRTSLFPEPDWLGRIYVLAPSAAGTWDEPRLFQLGKGEYIPLDELISEPAAKAAGVGAFLPPLYENSPPEDFEVQIFANGVRGEARQLLAKLLEHREQISRAIVLPEELTPSPIESAVAAVEDFGVICRSPGEARDALVKLCLGVGATYKGLLEELAQGVPQLPDRIGAEPLWPSYRRLQALQEKVDWWTSGSHPGGYSILKSGSGPLDPTALFDALFIPMGEGCFLTLLEDNPCRRIEQVERRLLCGEIAESIGTSGLTPSANVIATLRPTQNGRGLLDLSKLRTAFDAQPESTLPSAVALPAVSVRGTFEELPIDVSIRMQSELAGTVMALNPERDRVYFMRRESTPSRPDYSPRPESDNFKISISLLPAGREFTNTAAETAWLYRARHALIGELTKES